jgi:tetratricopeptide (TPR) repeat protein
MRDAAYGLHTEVDRTVAHARAGRFLADVREADAVVAAHFELGGDIERAVAHYLKAADHAYRANDLGATVALVQRGLDAGAVGEARGILHSIAAPARFYRAEMAACWDDSSATLELLPSGHPQRPAGVAWRACAAVHLGKQVDTEDELQELLTSEPEQRDLVDYGVALGHALIGHTAGAYLPQARRILERLIEIDARVGKDSPLVRGHLYFGRAWYLLLLGEDPYAPWQLVQRAAECHQSMDYYLLIYSRAEVACCASRFLPLEDCLAAMREAVRSVQGMRVIEVVYVSQLVANCLLSEGDLEHQDEAYALALAAAQTGEMNAYRCIGVVSLARACLRAGDMEQAEAHAREACAMLRNMGMRAYYAHADAVLLEVLFLRHDSGAAAVADAALKSIEEVGSAGFSEIPLRLAAAEVHLAARRRNDATRGVERALAGLGRRAATIPDASQRARYLGLREHARLLELAGALGLSGLADT